jgi:dolichol-phosphate mannosyltransferase
VTRASGDPACPDLSVVVPTYNERDRLAELVAVLRAEFQSKGLAAEIVVVDDNSPDGTGAIADAISARDPLVRVVHRPGKMGLGTAVMDGFARARADVLGVLDADLSHPPATLVAMFGVMQAASSDMVVGSRYVPGGGEAGWSKARLLMSRFACLLARALTPVRDATSGLFLVRRDVITGVAIAAGGFKICLELLVRGRPSTVAEAPYVFTGRTAGESKMNLKEALGYLTQLRALYGLRARGGASHPRYRRISPDELARPATAAADSREPGKESV